MSRFTKQALTESFLKLAAAKPIEKITVREIVEDCGLNRNTFYYHFSDIFALIEELLTEVLQNAFRRGQDADGGTDAFIAIIDWIDAHRVAFRNLYAAMGRDRVESAVAHVFDDAMTDYVRERMKGRSITTTDVKLISGVCRSTFFGMLNDWIKNGMRSDPRESLKRIEMIFAPLADEVLRIVAELPPASGEQ